ncbi:MAG: TlpA disulfide reductase family protein [Steroidobacteraceae bacterium]
MRNRIAMLPAVLIATLALAPPAWAGVPEVQAPGFTLQSSDGKPVSLAQFKGDVVMINFWASWCGPCRQEMPLLDEIYKQYKDMGFTLLGVNVEPHARNAHAWLKQTPVSYPILYDPKSQVSQLYQVQAMPTTVIIDRKGIVRFVHSGYLPGDENQYMNSIRALIVQ